MKYYTALILIISLGLPLFTSAQEPEMYNTEISIFRDSATIHGTLTLPPGITNPPFVLLIAGSGPTDRDGNNPFMKNNSLKMIAQSLSEAGIAAVRYDKRLIAKSASPDIKEENLRFRDYVLDAVAWVKWIKAEYTGSPVFIAGHSEGSLIGMSALTAESGHGFISLAGVGRPADLVIREQLKNQPPKLLELAQPILDSLKQGIQVDTIHPFLFTLFRPSVQPYIISWFEYDPAEIIQQLDIPCLIIQGTTDIQVAVKDAEILAGAKKDAQLVILEGMNHVLKEAPSDRIENLKTYNVPDLPLHEGLMTEIIRFIRTSLLD